MHGCVEGGREQTASRDETQRDTKRIGTVSRQISGGDRAPVRWSGLSDALRGRQQLRREQERVENCFKRQLAVFKPDRR